MEPFTPPTLSYVRFRIVEDPLNRHSFFTMRTSFRFALAVLGSVLAYGLASGQEISLTPKTIIQFASAPDGRRELGKKDAFIEAMSPFDRTARMQSDQPVGEAELLRFISAQALSWQADEIRKWTGIIGSASKRFASLTLELPPKIMLVKTSGKEEGNAAYCRSTNVIVLPQDKVQDAEGDANDLFIHELFHILSRNNSKLRDDLYGIVGFKPCPAVELPDSLQPRKITNPDAPRIEHYIEVVTDGKNQPVVPILFSNQDTYQANSGKSFFAYLTFKLMAVEKQENVWRPKLAAGQPWLLDVSEVKNFHEQIGRNTGYVIHPEELLADNFVLLVNQKRNLPSPEIVEKMGRLLAKPEAGSSPVDK